MTVSGAKKNNFKAKNLIKEEYCVCFVVFLIIILRFIRKPLLIMLYFILVLVQNCLIPILVEHISRFCTFWQRSMWFYSANFSWSVCVREPFLNIILLNRGSYEPSKANWSTHSTRGKVLCPKQLGSGSCRVDPTCCCWEILWETWPWLMGCLSQRTCWPSASSMTRSAKTEWTNVQCFPVLSHRVVEIEFLLSVSCTSQVEERKESYINSFDIVLVKDETMDVPNAILAYITSSRDK